MKTRILIFVWALFAAMPAPALTPNMPAGSLLPGGVVQTRFGPMNCIVYAPRPIVPVNYRGRTRGVYAADISVGQGLGL
jgi:hypothetical protein